MKRPEQANWLDDAIAKTVPGEPPRPDFAAWQSAHARALASLARRAQRRTPSPPGIPRVIEFGRRIMQSHTRKLAIAAAIVLVVLSGIHYLGGSIDGTSRAFANVCRNVTESTTVRFVTRSTTHTAQVYEKDGYLVRTELQAPEPMPFDTVLMDKQAGNYLYMDSNRKVAWHPSVEFRHATSSIYELFTNYRQMPDYAVEDLGKKRVGDCLSVGFRLTTQDKLLGPLQYDIWTDPETRLPIRIDFAGHTPDGHTLDNVTTDIVFDEPLDDALFDFEPEGFQIIDEPDRNTPAIDQPDTSETSIQDHPTEVETAEPNTPSVKMMEHSEPPTGIAGVVLDTLTQRPIEGATVRYIWYDSGPTTRTDTSGRFVLTGIRYTDRSHFSVIAKGYASKRIVARMVQGQITRGVRIELNRGSRVAGVVTDPVGNPVSGVKVSTPHFANRSDITGPDGRYEIEGLNPVVDSTTLDIYPPDHPALSLDFSPASAGQTVYQDVTLAPGADVYGQVTDPDGRPLAGVTVGNTESGVMWNRVYDTTDHQGRYRLKNVDLGELVLWAVHAKYALHVQRSTIASDTSELRMDIQLQEATPLRGRIIDQAGEPVAGADIIISEYDGILRITDQYHPSDEDGWFVIPNAPAQGTLTVYPHGAEIADEKQVLELGQAEYIVKIRRAGRVYGKVVADATDKPISDFTVKLRRTEVGEPIYGMSVTWFQEGHRFKSSEGFFDTGGEDLPIDGQYRVTVFAEGFDALTLDPVVVQSISEDPNRTEFRLTTATLIAGVVVDEDGEPIKDAAVSLFAEAERHDSSHWKQFTTDEAGVFVVSGISEDQQCMHATAPGCAPVYGHRSQLQSDGRTPAQIVLSRAARVFGTVCDDQGRPMAGVRTTFYRSHSQVRYLWSRYCPMTYLQTKTDAQGHYAFSGLPIGRCNVRICSNSNDLVASKTIMLSSGQEMQVDFGNEEGFAVSGIVRRGRIPMAGIDVATYDSDNNSEHTQTDSEGRFQLARIPSGRNRLMVHWDLPEEPASRWTRGCEERILAIDGDLDLDIDLGAGSISGFIPAQLHEREGRRIDIRRQREAPSTDARGVARNWEHLNGSNCTISIAPDGAFACNHLRAGRYHLRLRDRYRVLGVTDILEIGEAEALQGIEFRTGAGRLDIRVLDAQKQRPIEGAWLAVSDDLETSFGDGRPTTDGRLSRMVTGPEGRVLHGGLPSGRYRVWARAKGYLATSSDFVSLDNGETEPVVIALSPAALATFELSDSVRRRIHTDGLQIKCRVTDLNSGAVVPYGSVTYESDEHKVFISLTEPVTDLRAFLHLPQGRYRIEYTLRPYNISPPILEIPIHTGGVEIQLTTGVVQTVLVED